MWGIISDVYHQQPAENISPCFGYKPVFVTPSNLLNYMWLSEKWLRTKGIPILVCVTMKFTSLRSSPILLLQRRQCGSCLQQHQPRFVPHKSSCHLAFQQKWKKRQKRENFIAIVRKGEIVLGGDFSVPFRGHFGGIKTAVCIAIFIPSQIGPIFFI